jgi:translation initiation factor 1A
VFYYQKKMAHRGGKSQRRKAKSSRNTDNEEYRILFKEEGQEYAEITKILGNCRCECRCHDGKVRLGHIRGKMRHRARIILGDTVLVSLRDFQHDKVDIIHKYTLDEAKNLKSFGEIPDAPVPIDNEGLEGGGVPETDETAEVDFNAI